MIKLVITSYQLVNLKLTEIIKVRRADWVSSRVLDADWVKPSTATPRSKKYKPKQPFKYLLEKKKKNSTLKPISTLTQTLLCAVANICQTVDMATKICSLFWQCGICSFYHREELRALLLIRDRRGGIGTGTGTARRRNEDNIFNGLWGKFCDVIWLENLLWFMKIEIVYSEIS